MKNNHCGNLKMKGILLSYDISSSLEDCFCVIVLDKNDNRGLIVRNSGKTRLYIPSLEFYNKFFFGIIKYLSPKYLWFRENAFIIKDLNALMAIRGNIEYSALWGRFYKREYVVSVDFNFEKNPHGLFKYEINKINSLELLPDPDFSSDYQKII